MQHWSCTISNQQPCVCVCVFTAAGRRGQQTFGLRADVSSREGLIKSAPLWLLMNS